MVNADETHFWLVRHAPVDGPPGVIHAADAPANLADTDAIANLRARLPAEASCFVSPARRTMETAAALALAAEPRHAFREQDFGAWTGRRHDDLARELGETYRAFWRQPAANRPPGGESFADQLSRVGAGLAAMPAGDVILVVHSGTVRAALAIALDIAPARALGFVIDPLSLTRIDRIGQGWRIVGVNR